MGSPGVVLVNYPHHVIQRGHNRQIVFAVNDDYLFYLDEAKINLSPLSSYYPHCLYVEFPILFSTRLTASLF